MSHSRSTLFFNEFRNRMKQVTRRAAECIFLRRKSRRHCPPKLKTPFKIFLKIRVQFKEMHRLVSETFQSATSVDPTIKFESGMLSNRRSDTFNHQQEFVETIALIWYWCPHISVKHRWSCGELHLALEPISNPRCVSNAAQMSPTIWIMILCAYCSRNQTHCINSTFCIFIVKSNAWINWCTMRRDPRKFSKNNMLPYRMCICNDLGRFLQAFGLSKLLLYSKAFHI